MNLAEHRGACLLKYPSRAEEHLMLGTLDVYFDDVGPNATFIAKAVQSDSRDLYPRSFHVQ